MLLSSSAFYLAAGLFFIRSYKETLLISKLYEPAINFVLITAAVQVFISLMSCFYLNRKFLYKVDKPISQIENYLNNLTKKEVPTERLVLPETFTNIKNTGLLIKILVSYWKIEHIKSVKKISVKTKKSTKSSDLNEQRKSA